MPLETGMRRFYWLDQKHLRGHAGHVVQLSGRIDIPVLSYTPARETQPASFRVETRIVDGVALSVRAEEWIASTPKHVLLYQWLGLGTPKFAHMPLLRNADKSKISKRKNPAARLTWFVEQGYLPEALRTRKPQNEIKHTGKPMFDELYADEARLEQFMNAMAGISMGPFHALAETFERLRQREEVHGQEQRQHDVGAVDAGDGGRGSPESCCFR